MTGKRITTTIACTTYPMNPMRFHNSFSMPPTPVPSQDWRVRKAQVLQILDEVERLLSE
jgi:hypothetical protein